MADEETVFTAGGGGLRLTAGPVAELVLHAPERRNAINKAMWTDLPDICARVAADVSIRALIVRGEGAHFCAGADISEFSETYATAETTAAYNKVVRAAQATLAALPKPTIALIRSVCVGGGCGLAIHCDLRFAADDARFAITPAKLGLAYSFADTRQLVTLVGPARAKDILFSGRTLDAKEALSIGLIDRCVAPDNLEATVAEYAGGLAALSQTSIRTAKATINAIAGGADESTSELQAMFEASFASDDFAEGYRAFMEKRKPKFR